ncbi:MAG: OmpA family protein [Bacteroidaceae bacterium]|nr:OmpA family protein [Bacteroidaceae bacterium]
MKKMLIICAAGLMLTSCVSKKKYLALEAEHKELKSTYATLKEQNQATQTELAVCRTNVENLESQMTEARAARSAMQDNYRAMQGALDQSIQQAREGNVNIAKLVDEINASNAFIKQLIQAKDKSDSLNITLTNNLTRSLSKEELKEVDVQVLKGVVYVSLADNMLYESGSYLINSRASETLSKIAKIIKDYKDYDVLIEGNTDNVPINKTNIRNNWDLSCLRASSVVQELQNKYGVDPKRLTAGGRGEYNPIVPNDNAKNKTRNRRTQIIITPQLDEFMELIDQAPGDDEQPKEG